MAKKDKVSVGAWERIAKEMNKETEIIVDWHGEQLHVKRFLTLAESLSFVNTVIKDCFGEETSEYRPEAKRFSIDRAVLYYYSNITLPVGVEKQYDLICRTDAVDEVKKYVNLKQFNMILDAVEEKIEMLLDENVAVVNAKLTEFSEAMDGAKGMFDGVDPEDLRNLIGALSNGVLDEEKLMRAYLEAKSTPVDSADSVSE